MSFVDKLKEDVELHQEVIEDFIRGSSNERKNDEGYTDENINETIKEFSKNGERYIHQ